MFKSVSAAALLASSAFAGFHYDRMCQDPQVVQNFDKEAYTGLWFEQYKDISCPYGTGNCDTAQYSIREDGNIRVRNNDYTEGVWTGTEGYAYPKDAEANDGFLQVQFPDYPTGDYRVIATDYDNYSVVYGCTFVRFQMVAVEFVWILGRQPYISEESLAEAKAAIARELPLYDFDTEMSRTTQGEDVCPYATQPNALSQEQPLVQILLS